ncbi:MAG: glycosyltransferase family 9 protein [Woeseiaceae bacterium]|nr:glycosyltransferase family 9 protein [Woeseiaceae bacterium]
MPEIDLQSKPERICVIRLSAIGDTCHALAAVRRLQDNWPETYITWIIGKSEYQLMSSIRDIDFIVFDKSQGRAAYRDVRAKLKHKQFDVALCMHASMRANLLVRSIPSGLRLGFDRARAKDFQWLFTNRRIEATPGEHAMEAMLAFPTAIGARPTELRWDIPLTNQEREFAARNRDGARPLVLISPCSSQRNRNYRNWRADRYVAVINHLESQYGARVVITGGPSDIETEYGEQLGFNTGADNLVGRTSLREVAALIASSDLVICPDSGPAHIATAMGTPVIGLYATSNPARTGPYLSRELTVNRYPDAIRRYLGSNVRDLRWGQRVRHPDAMDLINVSDVTEKIDFALNIPEISNN